MAVYRPVLATWPSTPTTDGAGVKLHRVFGHAEARRMDPFLMLDFFQSDDPEDFMAGFPWHPHRGIETVTYMLKGRVEHGDSLGNQGVVGPGDVQWMTAGSGIIHEERPQNDGGICGLQLWVNLPRGHKMMDPRYQDVAASRVEDLDLGGGTTARLVAGELVGREGPVKEIVTTPTLADVTLPPGGRLEVPLPAKHNAFLFVFQGALASVAGGVGAGTRELLLLGDGEAIQVTAGPAGARLVLAAGKPLGEPIAWRGPIVMNSDEELARALEDYRRGTFIKVGKAPDQGGG
jgi:hypothetical protein